MNPQSPDEIVLPKLSDFLRALEDGKDSSPEAVLLKTILEDMSEGVLLAGEKGDSQFLNKSAQRIFGRSNGPTPPMKDWPQAHGIYRLDGSTLFDVNELPLVRALRGEKTDGVEIFMRNEDIPQGVFLKVRGRPLWDDQGKVRGGIIFCEDITGLKQKEISSQRLADLVAFAPIAIIETSLDARVVSWNSCAEKIYGYRAEEIVGKHYSMVVPILKIALMQEHARRLSLGEAIEDHDTLRVRKDGRMITTSCSASPLFGPDQRVRGFLLVTRETTGSPERSLADKGSNAILVLSPEGLVTGWNLGAERMFGYSKKEAIGLHYSILFPPGSAEDLGGIYEYVLTGEASYDFDAQGRRKDGEPLDVTLSLSPGKNEKGKTTGLCAVARDVTELKLAENRISQWKSLVDSSAEGVARDDLDGNILYWNKGCEDIYGYPAAEVLGKPFSMLMPEEARGEFQKVLDYIREGHGAQYEGLRQRKDGKTIRVAVTLLPLRDREGKVVEASIYIRDITERVHLKETLKRQEERMVQVQKMEVIGRMASGVAHDFNNLLTAIQGNGQILREVSLGEEGKEALENIQSAVDRAAELARQLLMFGSKQTSSAKPLDLNALVEGETKLLQRIVTKLFRLEARLGQAVPWVEADPMELRQVLMNLVVNARDAMPGGGEILLETRLWDSKGAAPDGTPLKTGLYAWLSVTDNGTGMEEETKKHIFEPFFTTKGEGKGTGLGLAIVYTMVAKRDGRVWVDSELGKGTTFHLCFPAAQAQASKTE